MVEKITNEYPTVVRNDEISIDEINIFDMIMLSPGPGIPDEAGILKEIISRYAGKKPIFGVCLGLQAIVEVFGGTIINMDEVYHGVATEMQVIISNAIIFKKCPSKIQSSEISFLDSIQSKLSYRVRDNCKRRSSRNNGNSS